MSIYDELMGGMSDPFADPLEAALRPRRRPSFNFGGAPGDPIDITPEEQSSLLADLAGGTMSGLEYAAGTLGKFGRGVRGLLGGNMREGLNLLPLPTDAFGWTDPSEEVSGRDLLANAGLATENDPNAWELADVAGFGVEVVTDPLTFVNPFQLTQAGKLAAKAGQGWTRAKGLAGNVDDFAMMAKGTGAPSQLAQQAIEETPDIAAAATKFLADAPPTLADTLSGRMQQGQAGLFGLEIPFTDIGMVPELAQGKWAQGIAADYIDPAAKAIGGLAPVRYLNQVFNPDVKGAWEAPVQDAVANVAKPAADELTADGQRLFADLTQRAQVPEGPLGVEFQRLAYQQVEGVPPTYDEWITSRKLTPEEATPELYQRATDIGGTLKQTYADDLERLRSLGVSRESLDDLIDYAPAKLAEGSNQAGSGASKVLGTTGPSQIQRKDIFRNVPGGRVALDDLAKDAEARALAVQDIDKAAEYVAQKYLKMPSDKAAWAAPPLPVAGAVAPTELLDWQKVIAESKGKPGLRDKLQPVEIAALTPKAKAAYNDDKKQQFQEVLSAYGKYLKHAGAPKDIATKLLGDVARAGKLSDDVIDRIAATDFMVAKVAGKDPLDHGRQLASWVAGLDPRHAEKGESYFSLDPIKNFQSYSKGVAKQQANAEALYDIVKKTAQNARQISKGLFVDASGKQVQGIGIRQFLKEAGLNASEELPLKAGETKAKRRSLAMARVKGLPEFEGASTKNMVIPQAIADDALKVIKRMQAPDEISMMGKVVDGITNAFRAWVTQPFPGYAARNVMDGAARVAMDTLDLPGSMKAAGDVGKLLRGGMNIEITPRMKQFGINTPADLIKEMYARNIAFTDGGHVMATEGAGKVGHSLPKTFTQGKALAGEAEPDSVVKVATDFAKGFAPTSDTIGGKVRDVLDPTQIGGVALDEDRNVIMKQARKLNRGAEDWIRGTHFLTKLRQGYSPDAAAEAVKKWHFDYSELTEAERKIFRRVAPFYCVPTDYEILTKEGWKKHDQLTKGEPVMSYDHAAGTMSWQPLVDVAVFDYDSDKDGELLCVEHTGRRKEPWQMMFTENHRWPVTDAMNFVKGKFYGGNKKVVEGRNLNTNHRIPLTAKFVDNGESPLSMRHAQILAWVVTDGYMRCRGKHCEMIVYQAPGQHLDEIIALLGTKPRKPHPDTGVVCVPVAIEDVREIRKVYNSVADFPKLAAQFPRDIAQEMVRIIIAAEGSHGTTSNQCVVSQCDRNLPIAEGFQILCTLAGTATTLRSAYCKSKFKEGTMWFCTARAKRTMNPRASMKKAAFKGQVWCPQTTTGFWVMRCHGTVILTGNTFARKNAELIAKELVTNPGKLGTVIKGAAAVSSGDDDQFVPPWIEEGLGIPLSGLPFIGDTPEGTDRYLSKLGLGSIEEPFSRLSFDEYGVPNLTRTAEKYSQMLNPLLKAPIEQATGRQMLTGRKLEDMRPYGSVGAVNELVGDDPLSAQMATQVLANTPASRFLSSVDKLVDERKPLPARLLNLLTGAQITDVDTAKSAEQEAKRALDRELKDSGRFGTSEYMYIDPEMEPFLSEEEKKLYDLYRLLRSERRKKVKP